MRLNEVPKLRFQLFWAAGTTKSGSGKHQIWHAPGDGFLSTLDTSSLTPIIHALDKSRTELDQKLEEELYGRLNAAS